MRTHKEIFVIVNDPSVVEKALLYLEHKGYKLTILASVAEAIQNLKNKKPDAILLSWNLRNADIVKVFTVFSHTFNYLCVVFPEDPSPRTVAAMVKSRIPHTVFPPLSGPSFHNRIESLYEKHQHELSKRQSRAKKANEKVPVDVVSETGGSQVQQFVASEQDTGGQDGDQPKAIYKESNLPDSPLDESVQYDVSDPSELAPGTAVYVNRETYETHEDKYEAILSEGAAATAGAALSSPEHPVLRCAMRALEGWAATFPGLLAQPEFQTNPSRKVFAVAMSANSHKGFFVFVCPKMDELVEKAFFDLFAAEMQAAGEKFEQADDLFTANWGPSEFLIWSEKCGHKIISKSVDGCDLSCVFVPLVVMPRFEAQGLALPDAPEERFVGFDQADWLVEDSLLNFDLYLKFPQNGKFVLYLKQGIRVNQRILKKFNAFQVKAVFITGKQRKEFFAYCFENLLKSSSGAVTDDNSKVAA